MKLPPNATLAFPGVLFDVYQWNQEMYDGSLRKFEMLERKSSADVLIIDRDRILITEEEQPGKWIFPSIVGGGIENGESPRDCIIRELCEEIGHEAGSIGLFREYHGASSKLHYHESLFIAHDIRRIWEPRLDGGERITFRWVTFDEFLQLARDPKFSLPLEFKFEMYEALLDKQRYHTLRNDILQI